MTKKQEEAGRVLLEEHSLLTASLRECGLQGYGRVCCCVLSTLPPQFGVLLEQPKNTDTQPN